MVEYVSHEAVCIWFSEGSTLHKHLFCTEYQDPHADTSGASGIEWYWGTKYLHYTCGKMYQN